MPRSIMSLLMVFACGALPVQGDAVPEALVVVVGDQHSAYERTAQFVGRIDRLQREHPGVPLAVLINGDSLEYGNVVAWRTAGADVAVIGATTFGAELTPGRMYRLVTTDWVAKNARTYLGDTPPVLTERSELKLKAAVIAALNR